VIINIDIINSKTLSHVTILELKYVSSILPLDHKHGSEIPACIHRYWNLPRHLDIFTCRHLMDLILLKGQVTRQRLRALRASDKIPKGGRRSVYERPGKVR
jgi:hypothetical protein